LKSQWNPGDACVLRGIAEGRVWLGQSVIVVKDEPQETLLLLLPGAQCAYPEAYWRWQQDDYSQGTRWDEARKPNLTLREFDWQTNRILMFLEPEKYFSCWMFWNHAANLFDCYYVNFQLPYRRTPMGFDTFDLELDLVLDAQLNWRWKDEDDYRLGILEGAIRPEWIAGIEQAKEDVFERIRRRVCPFDGSCLDWKPNPAWLPPRLPSGWREL
jgi:hypothetical protein